MGTSRDRDRFVVITDGRELMHLVLLWRGQSREAASRSRRARTAASRARCRSPSATRRRRRRAPSRACSPAATRASSSTTSSRNEAALAELPPAQRQIAAALAGQDPINAPYGMERIDWDPRTRHVPLGVGQRRRLDPQRDPDAERARPASSTARASAAACGASRASTSPTGESSSTCEASPLPDSNSIYAATEIGPEGDVWQGTAGGIDIYRGPDRDGPRLRCFDLEPPTLARVRLRGRVVAGRARDTACGRPAPVRSACGVAWSGARRPFPRPAPPRAGRVTVRAVDRSGQRSPARTVH